MQYIRRLASQNSTAEPTSKVLQDGEITEAMSNSFNLRPNAAGMLNAVSWSFNDLDKGNRIDGEGDIVIIGRKRDGVFQALEGLKCDGSINERDPPRKRLKIEHDRVAEHRRRASERDGSRSAIKLEQDIDLGQSEDDKRDIASSISTAAHTNANGNGGAANHSQDYKFLSDDNGRPISGTRLLPFIVEDDSDDDEVPKSPPSRLGVNLRDVPFEPQTRLPPAEEAASRLESRRLRQIAQERKQHASACQEEDTGLTHVANRDAVKSSNNVNGGLQTNAALREHQGSGHSPRMPHDESYSKLHCDTPIQSMEFNPSRAHAPTIARDPADVRRDLARRLENRHLEPSVDRQRIDNAWRAAEIERRAASAKVRKETDARKDAEWHKRQARERMQEQKIYEEKKRAEDARRRSIKKAYTNHRNDEDFKVSALERLQQANAARKIIPAVKAESESPERTPRRSQQEWQTKDNHNTSGAKHPRTVDSISAAATQTKSINGVPVDNGAGSAFEKSRQDRIKAKQERNARLHQGDLEQEDETMTEVATLRPPTDPSNIPRSLNSLEGQALLARSDKPTGSGVILSAANRDAYTPRKYLQCSEEILPQDIKLLVWRDSSNMLWSEIEDRMERLHGQRRSESTLRRVYRQVKYTIERLRPEKTLLRSVLAGDPDALAQLNASLTEKLPHEQGLEPEINDTMISNMFPSVPPARHTRPPGLSSAGNPHTERHDPEARTNEDNNIPRKGQVAGKTLGREAFEYYFKCLADEHDIAISQEQREVLTREDRCHFEYHVQRRQITNEQMKSQLMIDDTTWITVRDIYDDLSEANIAASAALVRTLPGDEHIALEDFTISRQTTDGLAFLTVEGENGIAQTRVVSFMRSFQDGELPSSKRGLISRTLYAVMEMTETTYRNEMFGEAHANIESKPVSKTAYTSLSMANESAVKRFIALGFDPESCNLNVRDLKIRERVEELLFEIDDEAGEMFCDTLENDDGTVKKTISVEEWRLNGPRNIR